MWASSSTFTNLAFSTFRLWIYSSVTSCDLIKFYYQETKREELICKTIKLLVRGDRCVDTGGPTGQDTQSLTDFVFILTLLYTFLSLNTSQYWYITIQTLSLVSTSTTITTTPSINPPLTTTTALKNTTTSTLENTTTPRTTTTDFTDYGETWRRKYDVSSSDLT